MQPDSVEPSGVATAAGPGHEQADIVVVGGGPGGSTTAALLARRGWRVVLLEKARHPRFHIGESLLPMNLPILERLGVLEQVRALGVRKPGAEFPAPDGSVNAFSFSRMLLPGPDHAFQVPRAEFDQLLLEHARSCGVDVREQVRAGAVEWRGGRPVAILAQPCGAGGGAAQRIALRYLVDASGRDTLLGSALKLKRRNRRHASAALFTHFRGVERTPGEANGHISVTRFEHGWTWLIPLPGDITSIGVVGTPAFMRQRGGDSEGLLMRTLMADPHRAPRLGAAERVAPVHATGNYSYDCRRMAGPGWLLVGDAYAFVDPIFSSGVLLAMDSGEQAAAVIDASLRDPARERMLQRAMARRLDRGLAEFSWFIRRFHSPVMRWLFANPRNNWQVEQAVISMLAGDVFGTPAVLRRLRIFRLIYAVTALTMAPHALRLWWRQQRGRRAVFAGDTVQQDAT